MTMMKNNELVGKKFARTNNTNMVVIVTEFMEKTKTVMIKSLETGKEMPVSVATIKDKRRWVLVEDIEDEQPVVEETAPIVEEEPIVEEPVVVEEPIVEPIIEEPVVEEKPVAKPTKKTSKKADRTMTIINMQNLEDTLSAYFNNVLPNRDNGFKVKHNSKVILKAYYKATTNNYRILFGKATADKIELPESYTVEYHEKWQNLPYCIEFDMDKLDATLKLFMDATVA